MRSEITGPPPKFKTLKFFLGATLTKIRDAPHIGIHSAWVLCKNPNSSQRQNNCGNLFHILAPCFYSLDAHKAVEAERATSQEVGRERACDVGQNVWKVIDFFSGLVSRHSNMAAQGLLLHVARE